MINIVLNGANGRMGQAITKICQLNKDKYNLEVALVRDTQNCDPFILTATKYIANRLNDINNYFADVILDFSQPQATLGLLNDAIIKKFPLVIGTTGFNSEEINLIKDAAKYIPIVLAANTSLSVNVLFAASKFVANKLREYEVEISEAHHRYKKDAPSGTALKIGEIIANERGLDFKQVAKFDRTGVANSARLQDEIGFAVTRGGDIVGRHDVAFISDGEIFRLVSEINNRASFAYGALVAANWVIGKPAGLYSMQDVLGLNNIAVIEKIEDALDIKTIEEVIARNETTYSLDEIKRELD